MKENLAAKIPELDMKKFALTGPRLRLRPLNESDISQRYVDWMNDPDVVRYMRHRSYATTMESLAEFIRSRQWPKDLTLAIIDQATGLHIGNIGLTAIDWMNHKAELGMLLGDKAYWNKGYMNEAFALVEDFAFSEMNLNKLYAGTEKDNAAAAALFAKRGWRVEGEFKEEMIRDGRFVDVVRFARLKADHRCEKGHSHEKNG